MNYSNLPEHLRKRLLLMQGTRSVDSNTSAKILNAYENPSPLPTHDWGIFGEFQYLGVGTPYRRKMAAGVEPTNDLDRIAMYHDGQYAWTGQHKLPGAGIVTSGMRGISDYGAGAAMFNAAINPWSDLDFKTRVLAFIAGDVLMIQGIMRLNPVTWGPMAFLDWLFY